MGATLLPPRVGWYLVNALRVRYLDAPLIFRFLFPRIHFVQGRWHDLGPELLLKSHWSLHVSLNSPRLTIRCSHAPLLEILLCSH